MMDWLGRSLEREEEVHHRNRLQWDNWLGNLEVVRGRDHRRRRGVGRRGAPVLGRRWRPNFHRGQDCATLAWSERGVGVIVFFSID